MRMNAPNPAGLAMLGAFIMLPTSCAESPSLGGLEEHPAIERLMLNTRVIPRSQAIPDDIPGGLRVIAERLREATEVVKFGELDGPQQYVFGDLADISITGDTVYALEPTVGEVRLFTTQGAHVASFGSEGQGPNELADPRDIEVGSSGQFAILERNGIKIFSIEQREMVLNRLVIPVGALGGASLCMLSDTLFVVRTRGLRMDKQLHVYTSSPGALGQRDSTDVVTRFGVGYPFGGTLVRGRLSRGPMACPSPTVAVIAYHDLPLIEAFGIDGRRLWKTGLAEFDPVRTLAGVDPEDGAEFIRSSDTAARHRVQTVTTLPGGFLLVQVSAIRAGNYLEQGSIDSYVFEVNSGLGVFVGDNLPGIKDATDDILVGGTVTDDMAPQVAIWKY